MKSSEEMMSSLLERREEYFAAKKIRQKKVLRTAVPVMALCLVLIGVTVWRMGSKSGGPIANSSESEYAEGGQPGLNQPPKDNTLNFTGEKLTDAEAKAYFEENSTWIRNALEQSGVQVEGFRILEKGYAHINYEGDGKALEVHQNFRDYLAYSGDKLVAIITLVKEDGKLYATPSFDGPWFDSYNAFLKAHAGQKLIYLYYGIAEVVLLPDGSVISPLGSNVEQYFGWVKNPYEWFYNEEIVYVP